ncbi:hypothetical protein BDY24DRAFT_435652 [Mrakia frigida]|uniref:NAD(P)/FAD-dependent oxidoreductase n=1 Tax=Mrakia frigida TaxID=29902 RepID=UPI003FCC0DA7
MTNPLPLKDIVVVGGSYVGLAVVDALKVALEPLEGKERTHRVVVVEKNSHFGHLFAYPRFAISPGSEHKAFIPFTSHLFPPPHLIVQASALSIANSTAEGRVLQLDRGVSLDEGASTTDKIPFDALVLATGTRLQPPGTMPGTEKKEGVEFFQKHQKEVEKAQRIVLLGGGAVGVQMATDIKTLYPSKSVVVVHSRPNLMPRFHTKLSEICLEKFAEFGIETELGSRAKIPEGGFEGVKEVELENGKIVKGDFIILSTGQTPNSSPLIEFAPSAVLSSGFIKTKPTLQIDASEPGTECIFAVGDIADTGAPKAARPGGAQAAIVANNILNQLQSSSEPLETYSYDPAAIHMTFGFVPSIIFKNPPSSDRSNVTGSFIGEPNFFWKDDGKEDMGIEGVWGRRAPGVGNYHL